MHHALPSFCKSLLLSAALGYASLFLFAAEGQAVSVSIKRFRGDWMPTTFYRAGDVVGYQNQSFIAQTTNHSQAPAVGSAVWYLLAAQGLQGPPGFNGEQGLPGPQGQPGVMGDPGPTSIYAYTLMVGQNPPMGDGTGRVLAAPDYATITAALNAIPANLYDPTAATCGARYLVKVLPGVYPETVMMKPCVDLEGSGEANTRISSDSDNAALVGDTTTEVRFVTVENTSTNAAATSVVSNPFSLTRVTVQAAGANSSSHLSGISGGSFSLRDVSVKLTGLAPCDGVVVNGEGTSMEGVTISVACGNALKAIDAAQVKVTNSSLQGTDKSLVANDASIVRIGHSELDGPVSVDTAGGASALCVGGYDGSFAPLTRNCLSPNALP